MQVFWGIFRQFYGLWKENISDSIAYLAGAPKYLLLAIKVLVSVKGAIQDFMTEITISNVSEALVDDDCFPRRKFACIYFNLNDFQVEWKL